MTIPDYFIWTQLSPLKKLLLIKNVLQGGLSVTCHGVFYRKYPSCWRSTWKHFPIHIMCELFFEQADPKCSYLISRMYKECSQLLVFLQNEKQQSLAIYEANDKVQTHEFWKQMFIALQMPFIQIRYPPILPMEHHRGCTLGMPVAYTDRIQETYRHRINSVISP